MRKCWRYAMTFLVLARATALAQEPPADPVEAATEVPSESAAEGVAAEGVVEASGEEGVPAATSAPSADLGVGEAELPAEPEPEPEPETVSATVRVVRSTPEGVRTPVAEATVRLLGASRGQAVTPQEAVTDSEGVARFDIRVDGTRWVASVQEDGLTYMSEQVLLGGETDEVVVTTYERRADPSALRIDRLVTVGSLNEGYLVFETYWFISVDAAYVFEAEVPAEGLEVRLPEGVEGIHVIEPDDGSAVAGDTGVTLLGPIGPRGALPTDGPSLLVSFSLPNEASRHEFAMPLPLPVDEAIILLPQVTDFERFPHLEVDLQVPVCGAGIDTSEFVCFHDPQSLPPGEGLMPNVDRREVHGGRGEAGATLAFTTIGWPNQHDPFHLVALLGIGVLVVGGAFAFRHFGRRDASRVVRPGQVSERHLQQERHRLLRELKRAEEEYEAGVLPLPEFEAADLVLRHRLETVYEALGVEPDLSQDGDDDSAADDVRAASVSTGEAGGVRSDSPG